MQNPIKFFLILLSTLLICCSLLAQPTRVDYTSKGDYTGTYTEIIVPSTAVGKYLVLAAVGGSGGHVNYNGSHRNGGSGAYVQAAFPVTQSVQEGIQPGDIIRFIVGGGGQSTSGSLKTTYRGGGGGGTGICHFNRRTGKWNILVVSGGGSGAGRGFLDPIGKPGRKYTSNMEYPTVARKDDVISYGGGAIEGYKVYATDFTFTTLPGMRYYQGRLVPLGSKASGKTDSGYGDEVRSGGWGFGPGGRGADIGGSSSAVKGIDNDRPGGGGGYKISDGATGGYSYINEALANPSFLSFERGTAYDGENGYALYEYRSSPKLATHQMEPINKAGYCISTAYGSTANNAELQLVKCNSTFSEKVNWLPDLHSFRLFAQTERCMDISSTAAGTSVRLNDCNNTAGQQWIYDGLTQHIRSVKDKTKCLKWDKSDNLKIKIETCAKINYQKWNVSGASVLDLGEYNVATVHPMLNENICIDNIAGKIIDGNPIQLWGCSEGNDNQKWFFDGYGIRLSEARDKCLDLPSTNNDTSIRLNYCHATSHGAKSHEWVYDGISKMIRYRDDINKCLSYKKGDTANGTKILIADCKQDTEMQWTLKQATPHPNDAIFGKIKELARPARCIDLKYNSASNGANIQSWPCNGTQAQEWFVQDKQIKLAKDLGMCIDLDHSDTRDNSNILLYQCHGDANQDWIFDVTYQFIRSSIDPKKCIYVNDSNDMRLTSCNYKDPSRMQWTFPGNYSERLAGDNLRIHLAQDEGKCVDMADNQEDSNVRVYTCQTDHSQYFAFDGAAIKRANDPNLCLDIEWGKLDNGTNIRLWHCNDTDAQKWIYDGVSGRIHSKKDPNKCLHIAGDTTSNGSNVEISDCNDNQAERFVIK